MRALVVVTGAVASGKTALAIPLARALDLPLLTKDVVKEALFDSLGTGDADWSKRLGAAAYSVLWAVAAGWPEAVLEANFGPDDAAPLRGLCADLVQVHCTCPPEVLALRFAGRDRHPGHLDAAYPADLLASQGDLDLDGPRLVVDTSQPVDGAAIADWARAALERAG